MPIHHRIMMQTPAPLSGCDFSKMTNGYARLVATAKIHATSLEQIPFFK